MEYPIKFDGQEVFGIYIHEPGPLVSNFAIATTCFIVALRFWNVKGYYARSWLLFVLFIGMGATGGMVVHGFPQALSPKQFYFTWAVKNSFVPVANFFAARAVLSPRIGSVSKLHIILGVKAAIVSILLFLTYQFTPAVVDLVLTYFLVLGTTWKKGVVPGARYLRRAFLIALGSGFLYLFPFNWFSGWFTNKDAVHVFVIVSIFYIASAIKRVRLSNF